MTVMYPNMKLLIVSPARMNLTSLFIQLKFVNNLTS
jgi:hypothetical protein